MPGVDMAPLVADDTRGKSIKSRVRCQPTPLHPYPFCAASRMRMHTMLPETRNSRQNPRRHG